MRFYLLIIALLFTRLLSEAQIPIAYYDFENNASRNTFQNQVEAEVNTSTSTAFTISTLVGTLATNRLGAGVYRGNVTDGMSITTYLGGSSVATDPTNLATHYLQFKISTSGFSGITLKFDAYPRGSGSEKYGVLYSINGISWTFVGSVATPGTGSYPWTSGAWGSANVIFPAGANNLANFYVRIYEYASGGASSNDYISFDNVEVGATSTVAGKVFTTLDEQNIYTCTTAGLTGNQFSRTNLSITGAGTIATLGTDFKMAAGNTFTVSTGATLNTGSSYAITGAGNFTLNSGTELVVTSTAGISNTAGTGNIQVTGTRILNGAANFTYKHLSGTAQITGTALPAALTGNLIINNSGGVALTQNTALSSPSVLYLSTGSFTNGSFLTLNTGTTINRDAGTLVAVPTFNPTISLIYSGSTTVTTGNEVPTLKTVLQDVTISKTALGNTITLGSDLLINGTLYPTTGTLNLANKNITLRSVSTATARVSALGASAAFSYTGTGRFFVERYISYARKWQLLSVPTDSTQTFKSAWQEGGVLNSNPVPGYGMVMTQRTGSTGIGFDATSPGGHSVKIYNPTTYDYTGITNTTDIITTTGGYYCYVRGDRLSLSTPATTTNPTTLRTKGKLYTGTRPTISIPAGLQTCVGNPYASAIDLTTLTMTGLVGASSTKGTVWVWDPSVGGSYGLGIFQTLTYNGSGYTVTPGGSALYPGTLCKRIESGAAFFVKGAAGGGTVTFTETAKTSGSNLVNKGEPTGKILTDPDFSKTIRANLSIVSGGIPTLVDGAMVYFNDEFEDGDDDMDATKLVNTNENTSIRSYGRMLAVDYRKLPSDKDTIFLNTANMRAQQYQLEIDAAELNIHAVAAYLEDRYTQTSVLLNLNGITVYDFVASGPAASFAADRFIIVFKSVSVLPIRFTKISATRNADKSVTVKWSVENESNILNQEIENSEDGIRFTVVGSKAANNTGGAASYLFTDTRTTNNSNYYRIKSKELSGRIIYSAITKAAGINEGGPGMSIYPNPIDGGKVNIHLLNTTAGLYTLKIITPSGQTIHTETDELQAGSVTKILQLPANTAPGTYIVSCTDKEGKTTTLSFTNPGSNK